MELLTRILTILCMFLTIAGFIYLICSVFGVGAGNNYAIRGVFCVAASLLLNVLRQKIERRNL